MNLKLFKNSFHRRAAALLLFFIVAFFAVFTALEMGHDCCGEGCEVCASLYVCGECIAKCFSGVPYLLVLYAAFAVFDAVMPEEGTITTDTLVSRKIRMND